MKKSKLIKAIISIIVVIALLLSISVVTFAAQQNAQFVLTGTTHSSITNAYVNQDTFKSGDTVYIKITTTTITGLGALSFTMQYDNEAFSFEQKKSVCAIGDSNSELQYFLDEEKGKLRVVFQSSSYNDNSTVTGAIFYLAFGVKTLSENKVADFIFKINDLYDNTLEQNDISCNKNETLQITLSAEGISETDLQLFRKLENITYTKECKADIDAGLAAFNLLSGAQKAFLLNNFTDEYEWVTTATYRYNRCAEQANKAQLENEINNFKKQHSKALALTLETATAEDYEIVKKAKDAFNNCSSAAKAYLQKEESLLIDLLNATEEMVYAKQEIADYLGNENFNNIFDRSILEKDFDITYLDYEVILALALIDYEILSDIAKEALKDEYDWLMKVQEEFNKCAERDAIDAEASQAAVDFVKTYSYAFGLNEANIAATDIGAIKIVLEAFEQLTDELVKEKLQTRIDNITSLMELAEELLAELGQTTETNQNDSSQLPGSSETTVTNQNVSSQLPSSQLPGGSVVNGTATTPIQTDAKIKTITNTLEKIIKGETTFDNIILFLFSILAFNILVLIATYILCEFYKKKQSVFEQQDFEEEAYE